MNSFDSWQTSLQRNRLKQNSTIEFNIKLTPCQNTFFDRILNESVSLQVNEVVKQAGAWKEYGRLNIYWTENESINNLAAITRVATPSKSNSVTAGFEQLPVASDHPSLSTTVMLHMHLHAWTIFTNESAVTLAGAGKQFMQKNKILRTCFDIMRDICTQVCFDPECTRLLGNHFGRNEAFLQRRCQHWRLIAVTCVATTLPSYLVTKGFEQLPVAIGYQVCPQRFCSTRTCMHGRHWHTKLLWDWWMLGTNFG